MPEDYRQAPLWQRLQAMSLDEPGVPVPFSKRLAMQMNWDEGKTQSVISEYRRFLYVMAKAGRPLPVPTNIDRVWQMHLTYTQHYRDVLCRSVLGGMLHYPPVPANGETWEEMANESAAGYEPVRRANPDTAAGKRGAIPIGIRNDLGIVLLWRPGHRSHDRHAIF